MSHEIDERYAAYTETLRCAAKEHRCGACKEPIARGHRYYVITWVWDRSADGTKRCVRCQKIHEHLRDLNPGETWPAENLDCGEEYEDHWGEAPPDEIAALAFVTPDELQASLAARKSEP